MKKIFIALSMMVIPLTAHAQSGGEKVVQAAADDLKPAFCANDLKQAIQIVEGCYAKVDEDSEKYNMNQCVVEDLTVSSTIFEKRKGYVDNFQVDPYTSIGFAQPENSVIRMLKHPNFMSSISDGKQRKQIIIKAVTEVSLILEKENCLNLDKLK